MLPDRHGRYGRYGGRFVPETLMPALLELEEAYRRISRTPEFRRELAWYLKDYVGRPTPLYFARHLTAELGGPADLHQAGGPGPHRGAQDQQHPGAGLAGPAHGQDPAHRRDRGGPARGGHRHGGGPVGAVLRHLHGHRRHPAPAPQRHPHAPVGGQGGAGGIGSAAP